MREELTFEQAEQNMHTGGLNCAQTVFARYAEGGGTDRGTAVKLAAAFGGGMGRAEVCGCVTGALMAIGLAFAKSDGGFVSNAKAKEAAGEFTARFAEENGSIICRELLGADISTPEGRARAAQSGITRRLCPGLCVSACEILDELL